MAMRCRARWRSATTASNIGVYGISAGHAGFANYTCDFIDRRQSHLSRRARSRSLPMPKAAPTATRNASSRPIRFGGSASPTATPCRARWRRRRPQPAMSASTASRKERSRLHRTMPSATLVRTLPSRRGPSSADRWPRIFLREVISADARATCRPNRRSSSRGIEDRSPAIICKSEQCLCASSSRLPANWRPGRFVGIEDRSKAVWHRRLASHMDRTDHSTRIDVDVFDCRDWPGYGVRLDVLGDRADDVQAASDVQTTSQGRWPRIADSRSCAASIAQFRVTGFTVHHLQFSDKLRLFFDASLAG